MSARPYSLSSWTTCPPTSFRNVWPVIAATLTGEGFSCRDQYLAMAFAQLTYRESLRDIEACLRSMSGKLYHLGFRGQGGAHHTGRRQRDHDWRIYADFAQVLIGIARPLYARDPIGVELEQQPLRAGFDNHRPMLVAVPVGQVSQAQGRRQDAHACWICTATSPRLSALRTAKCTTSTSWTRSCRRPARSTSWIGATSYFERLYMFTLCTAFFVVRTK